MSKFDQLAVVRWTVGIIGGLLVSVVVALVVGFFMHPVFDGFGPWVAIVGIVLSNALGLYCGYRSFRASVWPHKPGPLPGHCLKCGYNLTGNVSGICPECGTPCKQG